MLTECCGLKCVLEIKARLKEEEAGGRGLQSVVRKGLADGYHLQTQR